MAKTGNWKAFGSKYIKAENVANDTDKYVITKVDSEDEDGKETLIFTIEREGISKLFGCNATNEQAVKAVCPESPMQALGKVVTFNKADTTNPATGQPVKGLRIAFKRDEEPRADSGIAEDSTM